jgi:phosphopantetheine adenylyltransferase
MARWRVGEFTNQSLIAYARKIDATRIVRGLREVNLNKEFKLRGVAGRIHPSIPMVHFIGSVAFSVGLPQSVWMVARTQRHGPKGHHTEELQGRPAG